MLAGADCLDTKYSIHKANINMDYNGFNSHFSILEKEIPVLSLLVKGSLFSETDDVNCECSDDVTKKEYLRKSEIKHSLMF